MRVDKRCNSQSRLPLSLDIDSSQSHQLSSTLNWFKFWWALMRIFTTRAVISGQLSCNSCCPFTGAWELRKLSCNNVVSCATMSEQNYFILMREETPQGWGERGCSMTIANLRSMTRPAQRRACERKKLSCQTKTVNNLWSQGYSQRLCHSQYNVKLSIITSFMQRESLLRLKRYTQSRNYSKHCIVLVELSSL
jgi:hypothetical protein